MKWAWKEDVVVQRRNDRLHVWHICTTEQGGLDYLVCNIAGLWTESTILIFPLLFHFYCVYIPWVQDGDLGALTYFWITGDAQVSQALIRVYVDGEIEPSITYQPAKVRLRLQTHITEWVFSFQAPFYSLTRWSANIHLQVTFALNQCFNLSTAYVLF